MLTDMQKAKIRLYLGYPDEFRYKHTRLESMLTNLSPEAETLIGQTLTKIESYESSLVDSSSTNAGLKRVDNIEFETGGRRTMEIRKAGRMEVGRLSIITGVPIYSDVFGTGGYLGDSFSGSGGGTRTGRGGFYNVG